MTRLRRHCLVWLAPDAWRRVLAPPDDVSPWDPQALDCLQHWAAHHLPLVVTRQTPGWSGQRPHDALTLGLSAPSRWGRRRLFVEARVTDVQDTGGFPDARNIAPLLPVPARGPWHTLCDGLAALAVDARVYGSHGWQVLSGMASLHADSDIDLLVAVASVHQADAVVALLTRTPFDTPRLDGELVFADGAAVAWREWAAWRAGAVSRLLVKRVDGAALERAGDWAVAA